MKGKIKEINTTIQLQLNDITLNISVTDKLNKQEGNLENLKDIESNENYTFLHGDITDEKYINSIFDSRVYQSIINCLYFFFKNIVSKYCADFSACLFEALLSLLET